MIHQLSYLLKMALKAMNLLLELPTPFPSDEVPILRPSDIYLVIVEEQDVSDKVFLDC
jgi:hypothetical protein